MMPSRPGRLRTLSVCLLCSLPLLAQQPPQQKKANPFETVPESAQPPAAQPPKPQAPKLEPVKPAAEAAPSDKPPQDVVELVEFRGARRVPQDTLRALM